MQVKKFYDQNHANLYLVGSVIRVGGVPIYVTDVRNSRSLGLIITYISLTNADKKTKEIDIYNSKVDMTPVPLGFLNFQSFGRPKIAIRAFRTPSRQWRIGLTIDNLRLRPDRYNDHETKRKVIHSLSFKKSVCGEFPSLPKVLKMIKDKKANSQAFSRNFAIGKNGVRFIQLEEPVGKILKGEIMLFDDYLYLSELLEKDL